MEYLLEDELRELGLEIERVSPRGVFGKSSLSTLYDIALWSRLANRVNVVLFQTEARTLEQFQSACREFEWDRVFTLTNTFSVEFHGSSRYINNTMFGGQLVKDGVVDFFNQKYQQRPSIDRQKPNIRLQAYLKKGLLTVSLDVVGYSLHQRGYRLDQGGAPLKENIAAALLVRSDWQAFTDKESVFIDPFCGSATILIEAAMIATNRAPGLYREDQAFPSWKEHDPHLWESRREAATKSQRSTTSALFGFDNDPRAIAVATSNVQRAGFADLIKIKQQAMIDFKNPSDRTGLLLCNPPYGERLKDPHTLIPLYQKIGEKLFDQCQGFKVGVFTSSSLLSQSIGLKVDKTYQFMNGALATTLHCLTLNSDNKLRTSERKDTNSELSALANRLKKNQKHLAKWLKRTGHSCYRLYNADLPNYAFAIDIYNNWAHVQEYKPPKEIPEKKAQKRVIELLSVLPEVTGIDPKQIILKQRQRQRGTSQYRHFDKQKKTIYVKENNARLKVNLHDYLDTGLFLDHRPLREQIASISKGKRFLNCYCYTAAFSVHAALAGAKTCNIDLSNTYLQWAQENFKINNISLREHHFIQSDCLDWLKGCKTSYDIILIDPPSFSNSKRTSSTLDVQRDHTTLIQTAMKLLANDGVLFFSNNLSSFKLDKNLSDEYAISDITKKTVDEDFKRYKTPHRCYRITKK